MTDYAEYADEIAQARRCLDEFMTAFNARDRETLARVFHFPHVRLASNRLSVFEAPRLDRADRPVSNSMAEWHHSGWDRREVVHAGPDKVHFDTHFTRYRKDGSIIAGFDSLYVVTRENGRWGIKGRSTYAE